MEVDVDTLPSMEDFDRFRATFEEFAKATCLGACLFPTISLPRLRDAHHAWRDDLSRVEARESNLSAGLDHFKQCGHLTYWLRRCGPVVEFEDIAALWEEAGGLYKDEEELRDLLRKYGNEYMAFDIGLQICQYYELERTDGKGLENPPIITLEYLIDLCHFLKFKHVSPHSIYLIFRSLLLSPG